MAARPYLIPVLRGTVRRGARSAPVARLVVARLSEQPDVETRLVELEELELNPDDEGTNVKNPDFSALIDQSDGLVIVAPEYNHGYPASLKHALDTNYTEYVHKPVGLVGVSTGVLGGARMIENLLPILRAVGLVPIQRDVTVGNVADLLDGDGAFSDEATLRRIDGMLAELKWMAAVLRRGREETPTRLDDPRPAPACSDCGTSMNQHGTIIDDAAGGTEIDVHSCPICGRSRVVTD